MAVFAQAVLHRQQERKQLLTIGRPASRITNGVDLHLYALQPQFAAKLVTQCHDFGVDRRIRRPKRLYPKLVKLALPPGLRTLIAEHRPDIIQLADIRFAVKLVLHIGSNDTGGSFRTQRHAALPFIQKSIHFLLDDVRRFPYAPFEQRGLLKNRGTDFPVVKAPAQISDLLLDKLPFLDGSRQQILRTRRFLKSHIVHPPSQTRKPK
ncbi:hypothetical protein D3C81_1306530 [compost metagenome]